MNTPHIATSGRPPRRERGAVLVVGLVLLLVLTLAGVVLARMQTVEERMARNAHNHQLALQAAEAALRDAEAGIANSTYQNFAANAGGLYELEPAVGFSAASDVLNNSNWTSALFPTLVYAGPALANAPLARAPRFVIESLPPVATSGDNVSLKQFNAGPPVAEYRITAMGVGGDLSASAVVESIVK